MKEAILCCRAITSGGHKVLLLRFELRESYSSWVEFFRHMQRRGLRMPLLVTSDGAPGLLEAIAECFPESKRQRCTFHRLQNIRNKLSQGVIDELYPEIRSVFYQTNTEIAKMCAAKIIDKYADTYFSAIKCLQEDFDACIQHIWRSLPDITNTS